MNVSLFHINGLFENQLLLDNYLKLAVFRITVCRSLLVKGDLESSAGPAPINIRLFVWSDFALVIAGTYLIPAPDIP